MRSLASVDLNRYVIGVNVGQARGARDGGLDGTAPLDHEIPP
jgi:hypothetical protein